MADHVLDAETATESNSSPTEDVAIRVEDLTKRFGDLVAIKDISFDIYDHEFFTILGPSGSGKSTLLRTIAGLEDATTGTILIKNQDMTGVPPEQRPTNMIFQHLALFPHKNVYENLEFGLKMQGVDKAVRRDRADEMLDLLGLSGYGENAIDELSGGEQQRIALGRSLLTNPEILLLDEPLSSLDRKLKEEMQLELRRIHEELDSTFLYVTHDQDVALTASDRVAVVNEGELVQVGTPADLYETPANRFVAEFIGDTNFLTGDLIDRDEDHVTIETSNGLEIVIKIDSQASVDEFVELSLRPEAIAIGSAVTAPQNTYQGTVLERVYRGDRTRYVVDVDGHELLVQRSRRESDESINIDDTVTVGWPADAGYVLPGET